MLLPVPGRSQAKIAEVKLHVGLGVGPFPIHRSIVELGKASLQCPVLNAGTAMLPVFPQFGV